MWNIDEELQSSPLYNRFEGAAVLRGKTEDIDQASSKRSNFKHP